MKYRHFEWIVLAVGTVALLGAVGMSMVGGSVGWPTIVGELLILPVLAAAVHWGRKGGFVGAACAVVLYVVVTVLVVAHDSVIQPPTVQLVVILVIVYGAVGVVGGEVCGRMKYLLSRLGGGRLDADTGLYAEPVVRRLSTSGLARFRRYSTLFTLIVITIPLGPFTQLRPLQRRLLLRRTTDHVRGDLRLVDDVGRLYDGRIVVMMPSTPVDGARVVAQRLAGVVSQSLNVERDGIGLEIIGMDLDPEAVERFVEVLDDGSDASGYSASGS